MKQILITSMLLVGILSIIPSEAQTSDSARVTVCVPPLPIIASTNNGAGFINFCVNYPPIVQPGSTFLITSTLTAPTTVAPVFTTAANAFLSPVGCTEGTPAVVIPSANGQVGTMWTAVSTLTMISEQCDLAATALMTVAVVPLQIYNVNLQMNIQTENVRVDNYNFLCDAPGTAPNAFNTVTTVCNDAAFTLSGTIQAITNGNISLSGDLTVHDDDDGWIIHQDPLSGEITVNCVGCSDTVNIGSTNVTVNVNATGNMTSSDGNTTAMPQGFNGSLYVLMMAIVLSLTHIGETRRDNIYRIIAGGITFLASLVIWYELERLGFLHVAPYIKMALVFMGVQWCLALYLFYPKEYEKETDKT